MYDDGPVTSFSLVVPGEPKGQSRARHGNGRSYKDAKQAAYESTIQTEWIAAGRPVLVAAPYSVSVVARMSRPKNHYRKDGTLAPLGERTPYPTRKPDADNLLKQVDALVSVGAIPDDALMVWANVCKQWAHQIGSPRRVPELVIEVCTMGTVEDAA